LLPVGHGAEPVVSLGPDGRGPPGRRSLRLGLAVLAVFAVLRILGVRCQSGRAQADCQGHRHPPVPQFAHGSLPGPLAVCFLSRRWARPVEVAFVLELREGGPYATIAKACPEQFLTVGSPQAPWFPGSAWEPSCEALPRGRQPFARRSLAG